MIERKSGHTMCLECAEMFEFKDKRKVPTHCSVRCYNKNNNRKVYAEVKRLQEVVEQQTFLVILMMVIATSK